ncbi:MAG: efflux RND transporter periplasmic adaptor subunit [Phycisphaeraceae bacterium]
MPADKGTKRHGPSWWPTILGVVLVGALAALLAFVALRETEEEPSDGGGDRRPPVELATVEVLTLEETIRGVGTLQATQRVVLRPEIAGRIQAVGFEEGGRVEQGQLLFEIDAERLRRQREASAAALRSAEVRLSNAERTLDRQRRLREQGVVAEDELDRAQSAYDEAAAERDRLEAELDVLDEELDRTRIEAPFAGVISEREVDVGAYVPVGEPLATLYQIDPMRISFAVPERHLARLQQGQSVRLSVAAYAGEVFEGNVSFISPAVDQATRTVRVRAEIPNPDGQLAPGTFATASATLNVREDRPVVPEESLVGTRQGYRVYVVDEDDQAHARAVRTGLRRNGVVEILEGVEPGERVVRLGHLRVSDGDRVRITGERDADGDAEADVDDAAGDDVVAGDDVAAGGVR